MFPFSAAAPIVDLFIFVFVFSLFGCFPFFYIFLEVGGGWRGVFLHFSPFTSCEIQRSHFLPVIWSAALQKQLSGSNQKWVEWV